MIPTGNWSCESKPKKFRAYPKPLPEQRYGSVYDVKIGPVNLSESNGRLDSRYWLAYQLDDKVFVRGAIDSSTWNEPQDLFTETSMIVALSLSFDNLGRPVVFYKKDNGLFLWFYDSQLGGVTVKSISPKGITPLIDFDMKDDTSSTASDIMMYYVKDDTIYQRLQRDRFDIEYNTGVSLPHLYLTGIGNTEDNRFQVSYKFRDLRDGSMLTKKCLETDSPIMTQLLDNNLEVGFTIAKAPSICELRKLYSTYGIGWQGRFCVVSHAGNHYNTGHPNEEHLFTLEFMYDDINNDSSVIYVILRRTAFALGEYLTATLPNTTFSKGDFKLVFEQSPAVLGVKKKRIRLIKDDVTLIDQVVNDESSVVGNGSPSRNKLRFGASVELNTAADTTYKFLFPAVFTDIYTVVNGTRTDWPKTFSDKVTESIPSGNTLRLRRPLDTTYNFNLGE